MTNHRWKRTALMFLASRACSYAPSQYASRRRSQLSSCPLFSLSAASQERRDEEARRQQRKDDVIIGKTSAKRDATDYALNPKATEEEWMRQASKLEQKVFKLTEVGMESLRMLKLEDAGAAFDEVFQLKPNAYLWQAGIVKFYLGDFESAANIFAKNAAIYESKFGGPASEERIWRHACELKMASQKRKKGRITKDDIVEIRSQLDPIADLKEDPDSLPIETRKVFRIARDLFQSSVNDDIGGVILSRAKLRSIGGDFDDIKKIDLKQWRLNAWYFLGLHYDALGDMRESKECMKMAFRNSPTTGNSDNIVHLLPLIHMSQRDLFDDDEMGVDPLELLRLSQSEEAGDHFEETGVAVRKFVNDDPLVSDSIRKSIAKMSLTELQNALLVRGLKSVGYKKELQDRFFESLMSDAGLVP